MSARSPATAARQHIDAVRVALRCITDPIIVGSRSYGQPERVHRLSLRGGDPVPLRGDTLCFFMTQTFLITSTDIGNRPWSVNISGYNYTFEALGPRGASHELIAFHWHPEPEQHVRFSHVHLGYGAGDLQHGLDKAHIPTGRLVLAEIVRFAVTELGVEPLRADWEELLEAEPPDR